MKNNSQLQRGFTFVEAIIYVAIVTVMLTALIPFIWNIVEGGSKSGVQQEVSSNARYISERIKYEVRNSFGINNVTNTQVVLCETSGNCNLNQTTITFSGNNVQINDKGAAPVNLNSDDVIISGASFTDNSSGDGKTKNVSFGFTVSQASNTMRQDFKSSITLQGSAEVRSN